jgi:hypothetical protein
VKSLEQVGEERAVSHELELIETLRRAAALVGRKVGS